MSAWGEDARREREMGWHKPVNQQEEKWRVPNTWIFFPAMTV